MLGLLVSSTIHQREIGIEDESLLCSMVQRKWCIPLVERSRIPNSVYAEVCTCIPSPMSRCQIRKFQHRTRIRGVDIVFICFSFYIVSGFDYFKSPTSISGTNGVSKGFIRYGPFLIHTFLDFPLAIDMTCNGTGSVPFGNSQVNSIQPYLQFLA